METFKEVSKKILCLKKSLRVVEGLFKTQVHFMELNKIRGIFFHIYCDMFINAELVYESSPSERGTPGHHTILIDDFLNESTFNEKRSPLMKVT